MPKKFSRMLEAEAVMLVLKEELSHAQVGAAFTGSIAGRKAPWSPSFAVLGSSARHWASAPATRSLWLSGNSEQGQPAYDGQYYERTRKGGPPGRVPTGGTAARIPGSNQRVLCSLQAVSKELLKVGIIGSSADG